MATKTIVIFRVIARLTSSMCHRNMNIEKRIPENFFSVKKNGELRSELLNWYAAAHRDLPWRKTRDPYAIWISEVMLQQTTSAAVRGFYTKFLQRFPTVEKLADASIESVYEMWAGLGYYSRARNLHAAAKEMAQHGFPRTSEELLRLPGFGHYTARSVASLAFDEASGVVDGNVIRVLSRFYAWPVQAWKSNERAQLQTVMDAWVCGVSSALLNQAIMELGAAICRPINPTCLLCPLRKGCAAHAKRKTQEFPLAKPKRNVEIWNWSVHIVEKNNRFGLVENAYAPFLRGKLIFPGRAAKVESMPQNYFVKHSITHHQIYVQVLKEKWKQDLSIQWIPFQNIQRVNPSSLLQKVLTKWQNTKNSKSAGSLS